MSENYYKVRWNGWDNIINFIGDKVELDSWLKDGSLEEGDLVLVVIKRFIVVEREKAKLGIEDAEKLVKESLEKIEEGEEVKKK